MANPILNPAFTGEGRIFINPQGYGGGSKFEYHSAMKIDGLDRSLGDSEPVYLPNPKKYDDFIQVGAIKGTDSLVTSTLSGKLPIDTYSALEILAGRNCLFNLQVHYGRCSKPDDFTTFESAIILKDARLTSYNLSTLVAANPGERALIDETAALTIKEYYRVFNQSFLGITPNATGRVLSIQHADISGCDELCSTFSDGNKTWLALVDATTNDFSLTIDGGFTWNQFATGATGHTATHSEAVMAVGGSYVFWTVTDNSDATKFYAADLATVLGGFTPTAIELNLTSTFRARGISVSDSYVYIVGTDAAGIGGGEVWRIDKNTLETLKVFSLNVGITAVHALTDDFVAIGTSDGEVYTSALSGYFNVVGAAGSSSSDLTHIHMHDERHWVAVNQTNVWATADGGVNWTRTYSISYASNAERTYIEWYDNLVGYMIYGHHLFRTIDSGTTWKKIYSGPFAAAESLVVAISPYNPNLFMGAYTTSGTTTTSVKGYV